jgi:hypothetical protein
MDAELSSVSQHVAELESEIGTARGRYAHRSNG